MSFKVTFSEDSKNEKKVPTYHLFKYSYGPNKEYLVIILTDKDYAMESTTYGPAVPGVVIFSNTPDYKIGYKSEWFLQKSCSIEPYIGKVSFVQD